MFWRAISIIALILLSACTPQQTIIPNQANQKQQISFAGFSYEQAHYEQLIQRFEQQNPSIQVSYVSIDQLYQGPMDETKLQQSLASSADTFSSSVFFGSLAESGVLLDLRPIMQADASFPFNDYPSAILNPQANTAQYVLPQSLFFQLISYNRDLVEQAGINPDLKITSWSDLLGIAEQLTQRHNDGQIAVYGIDDGRNGFSILQGLILESGLDLSPQAAQTNTIDQQRFEQILQRIRDLVAQGVIYTNTEAVIIMGDQLSNKYRDGQVAIWFDGNLISQADNQQQLNLGSLALPILPKASLIQAQGFVISIGTQNPQAAWQWISFLSQQDTVDLRFSIIGSGIKIPARISKQQLSPNLQNTLQTTLQNYANNHHDLSHLESKLHLILQALRDDQQSTNAIAQQYIQEFQQLLSTPATPQASLGPIQVEQPKPTPTRNSDTISIRYPLNQQLQAIADAFYQETGIFIEAPSFSQISSSVEQLSQTYDCFVWYAPITSEEQAYVRDLQPLLDAEGSGMANDYPQALLQPFRSGNKLYGLPYQLQLRTLKYNPDLFQKAGLTAPSQAWQADDLLNAVQSLSDSANNIYGYAVSYNISSDLRNYLHWRGLEFDRQQLNLNEPQYYNAINEYLDLLREHSPHTRITGYQRGSPNFDTLITISSGQVGIWDDFANRQTFSLTLLGGDTFQTAQIAPQISQLGPNDFTINAQQISAQSQQPQACWSWLRYLSEQASIYTDHYPARSSIAQSSDLNKPQGSQIYASYAPHLQQSSQHNLTDDELYWFFQAIDQVYQGQATLETALRTAQDLTQSYLACRDSGQAAAECANSIDPNYQGFLQ